MAVITISRQYGSGGSSIARMLSERLGWHVIDNEFVDRVAECAGVPRSEVAEREERVPSLVERLARALSISSPEVFVVTGEPPDVPFATEHELVRATEAVIGQGVREEANLILVGRGAQSCLAQKTDTLHVFVVGPLEARIEAVMQRLGIGHAEAEEAVDRTDAGRRRYVKTYYDRAWDDPVNYDLVVNTGRFTHEQATDIIIEAARRRGWAS